MEVKLKYKKRNDLCKTIKIKILLIFVVRTCVGYGLKSIERFITLHNRHIQLHEYYKKPMKGKKNIKLTPLAFE